MKAPSVFLQVVALAFATLVIAFAASVAVVVLTPTPQRQPLSVARAAAALRRSGGEGLSVWAAVAPPAGPRSPALERALAKALAVPPARVRAAWDPAGWSGDARRVGTSIVLIGDRPVVIDNFPGGFFLHWDRNADLPSEAPLPAFKAAVLRPDGRWLSVAAADPWYAAWRLRMAGAFAGLLLVLAVPVSLIALRLARPIRCLAQAAAQGGFDTIEPFPVAGPREVRAAAEAMNAMHRQLVEEAGRRFHAFAALAHDLRTPLTALRVRAETAPPHEARRMVADIDRMSAMIADVLDFLKFDARPVHAVRLDLAALLADIVARRRELAQPVSLAGASAPVFVDGDATALERAVNNLIDNSLRYAGTAELRLECPRDRVEVHVDDDGPGIPADQFERVVAPFERLEISRNRKTGGAGLGLAIAERIARIHGGQLRLGNRVPAGLRATLTFPATQGHEKSPSACAAEGLSRDGR